MAKNPTVAGVRGWLAVLVALIGVLVPLSQFGSFMKLLNAEPLLRPYFGENWSTYFTLASLVMAARAIVCLFVAQSLLHDRHRSTPKKAIAGLWIALVLFGLISIAIAAALNPVPVSLGGAIVSMGWIVLICAIATLYLLRSKRVAATYCA